MASCASAALGGFLLVAQSAAIYFLKRGAGQFVDEGYLAGNLVSACIGAHAILQIGHEGLVARGAGPEDDEGLDDHQPVFAIDANSGGLEYARIFGDRRLDLDG